MDHQEDRVRPDVAASLAALEDRQGRLVAEDVVAEASNPDNPLHTCFEWDNLIAGHQFRLEQARTLIRRVKIVVTICDTPIKVIKYVSDTGKDSRYQQWFKIKSKASLDVFKYEIKRIIGNIERTAAMAETKKDAPEGLVKGLRSMEIKASSLLELL